MARWHIVTGEYPPQFGGVSDYTRLLAQGLAQAGDVVDVWAPECNGPTQADAGVTVHRLPGRFGPRALVQLDRALRRSDKSARLLVQYVPHMYGYKAMNVPFCTWLWAHAPLRAWVMFHEVAFALKWRQPLAHRLLAATNRVMAALVAHSAERIFVSIPQWQERLKSITPRRTPITWLPVPSNMPTHVEMASTQQVRQSLNLDSAAHLIGHFGTFSQTMARTLEELFLPLLAGPSPRAGLLLGRGSDTFVADLTRRYPNLAGRLHARSDLPADAVSSHLAACDVLVQPYGDGISSRRTSAMAGLALGKAVVTTRGCATEPVWHEEALVETVPAEDLTGMPGLIEQLLADPAARRALAERAKIGYERHFSLRRTIDTLRSSF